MAKSPEEALQTMIANFPENTGKALAQWIKLAKTCGQSTHGKIVAWLKSEHGMGHGYANLVAAETLKENAPEPSGDVVAAQYTGAKAALRPLYEKLVAAAQKFGAEVEVSPKKTCVSLRRNKQFVMLTAASATRIDVGLNLKGVPPAGRLEKSPNAMCTHRVRVEQLAEVDRELLGWMKAAYDSS